jgi:hypothetical protein
MPYDVMEEDTIMTHINKHYICTYWLTDKTGTYASWRLNWQLQLLCKHTPWGLWFDIYQSAEIGVTCNVASPWVSKEMRSYVHIPGPSWTKLGLTSDKLPQFIQLYVYIFICCERTIKIKVDLVGVREVRWDEGGNEPAGEYTFFYGQRNENHEIGKDFIRT